MKQIAIILISTSLFIGCRQIKNSNETNEKQTEFERYSNQIKMIKLPLETNCDEYLTSFKNDIPDSLIKFYGFELSKIYGKLAENENYTAIIYLYPADDVLPIIKTTDKNGNKIAVLSLNESYCGSDENFWGVSWAKIYEDLSIQLGDSSITFERDENGVIKEETKKIEVRNRHFFIDDNGQIIEKTKNAL